MSSPEMHTLAGAFAVDALSDHERARFQRHLEECESCAQEVRELRATAARLGAAAAVDPPDELKRRVLAEIRGSRQQPPAPADDRAERFRRRAEVPRWALTLVAAAAVAGLVLAGIFGVTAIRTQHELTVAQEQAAGARQRYAPVAELLAAPDSRTVHGVSTVGGGGTVVLSQSLNKMMFMGAQLPDYGQAGALEVWVIRSGESPRSIGLLPGERDGGRLVLAGGVAGATQVAVTVEPPGGSPTGQPSTEPVMRIFLPV
ncbi:anti-sigma factor [Amycolatopsis nigrescens]|uniref:anti-sigma factor n=1 Tax=Amycolatopsis nigrescens TaxID=381445 RepID=UPI00035CE4B4|nr:anti-sigma factor [Amycolatopsis nigrescens]